MFCKIHREGFTIIEILVVIATIGVLVGLLLPGVQMTRENARRASCSSNLVQVGLAISSYHSHYKQLPTQLSGTSGSPVPGMDNDSRLSVFVAIMPFLDSTNWSRSINRALSKQAVPATSPEFAFYSTERLGGAGDEVSTNSETEFWPAGGPEPFNGDYWPWQVEIESLRCPSDPGIGSPAFSRTNYAISLGDGIVTASSGPFKEINGQLVRDQDRSRQSDIAMRGVFVPRMLTRFSHITDGLSQTVMLAEIATGLGDEDIRTAPAVASSMRAPNRLEQQPNFIQFRNLIDQEHPGFWSPRARSTKIGRNPSIERGFRFADGQPLYTAFNTILPPNREITLAQDTDASDGVLPPSSRHWIGIHLCMADGSVRFVSNSIDAGLTSDPTIYARLKAGDPPPKRRAESPYGVWGAMGTRSAHELPR